MKLSVQNISLQKLIELDNREFKTIKQDDKDFSKLEYNGLDLKKLEYSFQLPTGLGPRYIFEDISSNRKAGYYISQINFKKGELSFFAICRFKTFFFEVLSYKSSPNTQIFLKNGERIGKCVEEKKRYIWKIYNKNDKVIGRIERPGLIVKRDSLRIKFQNSSEEYPIFLYRSRSLKNFLNFIIYIGSLGAYKYNYIPDLVLPEKIPNIKEEEELESILFLVSILFRSFYFNLDYDGPLE